MTRVDGFDWDAGNRSKCGKHGLTLDQIEAVFRRGGADRPVFVAFTLRQHAGRTLIRLISARFMHAKEIAHYEQAIARADQ